MNTLADMFIFEFVLQLLGIKSFIDRHALHIMLCTARRSDIINIRTNNFALITSNYPELNALQTKNTSIL